MAIIISEVNPSGSTRSYGADWFEVTNTGSSAVDITGWSIDDNSHISTAAVLLRGLLSIPAGKSVVFIENSSTTVTDATVLTNFQTAWFGNATTSVPTGFTYGFYGGSGVGLSGSGDEVNLFDAKGGWVTGIGFGVATPGVAPAAGQTFDNTAGVALSALAATSPLVSTLSVVGTNGAFLSADSLDIGSPGKISAAVVTPAVNLSVSSNAGSETDKSVITVTATATSAVTTVQTVALAVTGTGITAGDYTLSSPTITIPSGATSGTATFTVVDDTLVEGTETAILTISSPSAGIVLGTTTTQNLIITDNDGVIVTPVVTPAVNLSISSNAGSETAKSVITVTATATSAVATAQTVALAVTGTGITAGDYTLSSPTITIPSGATSGTATFTVVDDTLVEGTETAVFTISSPSAGIVLGTTTAQNLIITDNDGVVVPPVVTPPKNNTSIDLSTYVQVGRYDLPEPSHPGTVTPPGSLLAQEVSAVTYNWDTDTLFVEGDGGTSIVQIDKQGKLINSMTLAPDPAKPQGTYFYDPEGLTYVGGGKFVLQEERYRQANLFTYVPNATLYGDKTVDAAGKIIAGGGVQTVKLGTTIGNIGTEGITYDPFSSGFVLVKETGPEGIFQTTIDFAKGTASNGSPTTENSVNLFDPTILGLADLADVYSVSTLASQIGKDDYDHLLVLSQESGKVVNIDRTGKIYSTLTIDPKANGLTTPLTNAAVTPNVVDQSHEGITMDKNGFLYVTSENGGGDITRPQLWVYAPTGAVTPNQAPTAVTLNNPVKTIAQTTSTTTAVKIADIAITDDGKGTNNLSVTGADASAFEISSGALFLKAGTTLNSTTKASYSATVNVDDPTVGTTPDASTTFTLGVTGTVVNPPASASIVITEASPWSSGNSAYAADWFELTNTGTTAVDITGWKMDDNSNSFGSSVALRGVTSIAAGKSVIFIEGLADGSTDKAIDAKFSTTWFGTETPPAGVVIGNYGGSGVGLSTGGDSVNIFDASGKQITGISFVDSTASFLFTFDNAAGLGTSTLPTPTVSTLSKAGTNGGFVSFNGLETGSPGSIVTTPTLSIAATTPTATETDSTPGTFRITSDVKATAALTVNYTVSGTATNGVDYTRLLGTATIATGQTSVDVLLTPVDDVLAEGNETVSLTLATGTGYATNATKSAATVTVIDNEPTPVGTTGNDNLVATMGAKFDGQSNVIFTGDGNDIIDLAISSFAGGNRIDTGNGNDTIYVSTNDVIFGGNGNDIFDATGGLGGNRMSGDAGNDTFYLGKGDRALGGAGNDKFYVQSGGSNLISGGAGSDQFWLVNGELPDAPNTVLDFQIGTDVIGFTGAASLGINASTIKFTQVGADTNIVFGTQTLATLSGIQASQLNAANLTQFVFA